MLVYVAVVGACIGVVVGALGAGGGILSVPTLVYLLGQDPHSAATQSLIIVGLTALVSLATRARGGSVHWREGSLFALAGLVGTWAGSHLNGSVDGKVLMALFSALLGCVAVAMLRRRETVPPVGASVSSEAPDGGEVQRAEGGAEGSSASFLLKVLVCATLTGFLTGFFGVGGGFAIVPVLTLVMKFPMKEASATSLLIMVLTALFGLASRAVSGGLNLDMSAGAMIAVFTAASMLGGLAGAPLTKRVSNRTLSRAFGILLLLVAAGSAAGTFLS